MGIVRHWLTFAFLVVFGACSAVPENHYFTMAYALLPQKGKGEPAFPQTLRIRQLDIAKAYDGERIVYRYNPYEFQYYAYMLWAIKPQKMLTDLLARHLENAGLFAEVMLEYSDRPPTHEMSGMIHAVEELDSKDEWYAHLAFTLRITPYRGEKKVVWSHTADVKKRVYNREPVYVVKALSELMEAEMDRVVGSLREFLGSRVSSGGKQP